MVLNESHVAGLRVFVENEREPASKREREHFSDFDLNLIY